jgi:thiol-disulfide isomerase/thioredoxin
MALNITKENYEQILAEGKPVVIDFWATWCGPCRMISPIIEELAEEYEGKVLIGKCDVDANDDVVVAIEHQPLRSNHYSSDRLSAVQSVAGVIEWANGVKTPIFETRNQ